ncbi:MAG: hypothetical protein DHS20C18_37760 [Saprospiraceae bacterium]|nr:MAG: hypothetical protein DHS20C18_37760 [Saprospiraceae bacterium]
MKINIKFLIFLTLGAFIGTSCEKDYTNPGAATEEQVLNSANGLIGLAVGIQKRWSVGRQSPVYATVAGSGFTTFELRLINPGNASENDVSLGKENLSGSNGIVGSIWEQSLLVRNEAQKVLDNADVISDPGTRAGLIAYASIFKALANGTLAQFFEMVPLTTEVDAVFSNGTDAVNDAIATLEAANSALSGATVPSSFLSKTPNSIDLGNTVNALLARFYNQIGNNDAALAAAGKVDLSSTSTFVYDDVNTNPIAFVSILTNNVYQPVDLTLGLPANLQPDPADQRLAFYFQDLNPAGNDFRAAAFFNSATAAIPIYLPGEMLLIRAEAFARKNMVAEAVGELDKVLTKDPADDAFGVGAALGGYSGAMTQEAVLDAIYSNRAMELFMSGLRFADSKRFGRPGPNTTNEERNRNWYPYPNSERDNNKNTPQDPEI